MKEQDLLEAFNHIRNVEVPEHIRANVLDRIVREGKQAVTIRYAASWGLVAAALLLFNGLVLTGNLASQNQNSALMVMSSQMNLNVNNQLYHD